MFDWTISAFWRRRNDIGLKRKKFHSLSDFIENDCLLNQQIELLESG